MQCEGVRHRACKRHLLRTRIPMKIKSTVLTIIAAGTASLLTSCVDSYYEGTTTAVVESEYRPGYVIRTLPPGYRAEVIGGTRYYHYNNVYYRPQGGSYVVVDSPHRHRGDSWDGRRDRDWDGRRDRDWNDRRPGRDVTVVRELPSGYTVVNHRGQRYYRAGDRYYQSREGGYIIVGSPF